jgi:hypothetical protein
MLVFIILDEKCEQIEAVRRRRAGLRLLLEIRLDLGERPVVVCFRSQQTN